MGHRAIIVQIIKSLATRVNNWHVVLCQVTYTGRHQNFVYLFLGRLISSLGSLICHVWMHKEPTDLTQTALNFIYIQEVKNQHPTIAYLRLW